MAATVTIPLTVPEGLVPYIAESNSDEELVRNAMILYPHIRNLEMSHGYAAKLLGVSKRWLIELYNSLGMPYIDMTKEDLLKELADFDSIVAGGEC